MRLLALLCTLLAALQPGALGQAADEWVETFDTAEAWRCNNPRAPAKFSASEGVLTLIDPPGGEVTWGTSVYCTTPVLDLSKARCLVVKLTEVTASFRVTLVNPKTKEKVGGLLRTNKPGLLVLDIGKSLGWDHKTSLHVGLYASGTESRVRVDFVKITGDLSAAEEAAAVTARRMKPKRPEPFHGLKELASRRGWWHAAYREIDAEHKAPDREWLEPFDRSDNWACNNRRAPAEFEAEGGMLVLVDPPGGEVTWGTSIYGRTAPVNLDKHRYLVVKVVEATGKVGITLINRFTQQRVNGLCSATKPGVFVEDLVARTGWSGRTDFDIGIYTWGTESRAKLDHIKITGRLSPTERAALARQPAAEPVERFASPDGRPMFSESADPSATYVGERLVYRDSVSGNVVWRMTRHPGVDKVIYYDIPLWNANGSLIRWATTRSATRQWLMNADGSRLRPAATLARGKAYGSNWSVRDPDIMFYSRTVGGRSVVYRINVQTGEEREVVSLSEPGFSMVPAHPDEEHFLLAKRSKRDNTSVFYLLSPAAAPRKFDFGRFVHRLRFTRSSDHDVFYNFDDPRTQWAMDADGGNKAHLTDTAGHPDWTHDGKWFTSYEAGNIVAMRRDGSGKYVLLDLAAGGHGGPAMDNRSFVSDVSGSGPYGHSILFVDMPTRVAHMVCTAWSSCYGHTDTNWHPDHHSTHPHPVSSPDATKTGFSSDYMSEFTDLYVCINHLPDAPRGAGVDRARSVLTWQPGVRHRETAGYHVYRSTRSGGPYLQLTREPVTACEFALDTLTGFLRVTAVEPSGLESLGSAEVCAAAEWEGPVCLAYEAEDAKLSGAARAYMSNPGAVGMHYVGKKAEDKQQATLTFSLTAPRAGRYALWLRARGKGRIEAGRGAIDVKSDEWTWVRVREPLRLQEGRNAAVLKLTDGRGQIDQVLITDAADFRPAGPAVLDSTAPEPVQGLTATALDPFDVRLVWRVPGAMDVAHYNVYCSAEGTVKPDQAHLVGSPVETAFVDSALAPAKTYSYLVAAVDRAGNESRPAPARVRTPPAEIAKVEVEAESGKVAGGAKVVADAGAAGRKAVAFAQDGKPAGELTLTFDVPLSDRYAIWGYVQQFQGKPETMRVSIDGRPDSWRVCVPMRRWGWDDVGYNRSGGPTLHLLKKGRHELKLSGQQGQRLDRLVVTNDPQFEPPWCLTRHAKR